MALILLACLLIVCSHSSDPVDRLPDDLVSWVVQYVPETSVGETSTRLRHLALLPLNREYSRRYIYDQNGFRAEANRKLRNPRQQVRLNLGIDFRRYMVDADFRAQIETLVDQPDEQIWSDVETLELSETNVHDIRGLRQLVNLKTLDLRDTQVQDISALSGLHQLKHLCISGTRVKDVSALAELANLEHLCLHGTQVQSILALRRLIRLRIPQ